MTVELLKDQHILILGLGASGLAMARWCVRCGARVTVADTREAPPQLATLRSELPAVEFVSGAFAASLIEGGDIRAVFKSPGLTPASVAPLWSAAQACGLWVGGELDLLARALADLQTSQGYKPKVLAITGTNGKTTVSSLTGQLVERAGKRVAVAGNIGPTLLDTLSERLDAGELPEVWVLEFSSFQLDGVQGFEPTAAVVLNLTQDHLDWHGDMPAYGAAKARIFGQTGLMVLNREDPAVMAMLSAAGPSQGAKAPLGLTLAAPCLPAQAGTSGRAVASRIGTSSAALASSAPAEAGAVASVGARLSPPPQKGKAFQAGVVREHLTFGADMPQRPGDFGIEQVNGMAWLVRAQEADETRKKRKGDEEEELYIQRLMPADALRIRGRHNATNALAALALAQAAGCSLGPILYGLREYRGEPHRVESVGVIDGVEYFDDSKGTNVGATVAALSGLGEDAGESGNANAQRKLVVILGGDGKGQDFAPLAAPVGRHARAAVLIGRDAPAIRATLQGSGVPLLDADSMAQAVAVARQQAHPGDAVLMSPACASFDMFNNYEHRAQVFREAVTALAQDAGAVASVGAKP